MDLQIDKRVCLVTGASTGIGRATVLALAKEGALVIAAARNQALLQTLAEEAVAAGCKRPLLLVADLTDPSAIVRLADQATAREERIDVLVNNAGGSRPMSRPDDEAAWTEAFLLNFAAARRLTEILAPHMAARGWGRIINVTGAVVAKVFNAASPAKAALESWSKSAAAAYAPAGVTVNCVAPGRIKSPQILQKLHPTEESRQDFIQRNIPAGRFGEPEEAAALIAFLASAQASYVTGVTIPVDGGAMRLAF
jgi:3-oxoacyl-[acyl-carrier protein] reductase